jgi:hypothetical protein
MRKTPFYGEILPLGFPGIFEKYFELFRSRLLNFIILSCIMKSYVQKAIYMAILYPWERALP